MAQEKVSLKQGMGGTGKGRWCKRDIAKKASRVKRRQQDKKAIQGE
jgi:hypothetical protein